MQTVLVFSPLTANGKLMAISIGVCVPAFCLLIFIKDPLLPLSVLSEEGEKRRCVSPSTLNMIYHSGRWCSGVMRSLPFFLIVQPLGFAWLIYLAFLSCDKC